MRERVFLFFKKIGVVFAVFILLLSAWIVNAKPTLYNYSKTLTFYSDKGSDGVMTTVSGVDYIFILNRAGESFSKKENEFDVFKMLKDFNAEKVIEEVFDGKKSEYFYSDKINYSKTLYGKKVNIHVFTDSGVITVGTPIIYGSY